MIMDLEILTRNDHIRIDVISIVFMHDTLELVQVAISLGSVIFPFIADAATTRGDARNVCDSISPILPGKFLFVVLIQISFGPKTPICAPQQAPQVGGPTTQPASTKMSTSPSRSAEI
jgi:hypothetical protein